MSALRAAQLPGDVFQGKVDPKSPEGIKRAADLAMTIGGGGALVPRPKDSLGVFGKAPTGQLAAEKLDNNTGVISRSFRAGDTSGISSVLIDKNPNGKTVSADITFDAFNKNTLRSSTGNVVSGGDPLDNRKALLQVMSDIKKMVEAIGPTEITFTAARKELEPLYKSLSKRIAKATEGRVVEDGGGVFVIETGKFRNFQTGKIERTPVSSTGETAAGEGFLRELAEELAAATRQSGAR